MADDSPETNSEPQTKGVPHPLNLSLAGMPELELFETAEQRERALREIAREFGSPRSGSWWVGVAILLAAGVGTLVVARHALTFVGWPEWAEELIRIGAVLVVAALTIRRLHRWGGPADLRRKLIELGVPVCRGCGYSLRGLPFDRRRCPECGRGIEPRVRAILERTAVSRGPDTPA